MGFTDAAREFLRDKERWTEDLAGVARWLAPATRRSGLLSTKISRDVRMEEWLFQQNGGVFLMRLKGISMDDAVVAHVVVVEPTESVVCDCVDEYGIFLRHEALIVCVGDAAQLTHITQLILSWYGWRERRDRTEDRE